MDTDVYSFILSGGSGTRFWPLSRDNKPKQLLNLFSDKSMLELTINRLEKIIEKNNRFILTNLRQVEEVKKTCQKCINAQNIIAEPKKMDTAPAVSLAVGLAMHHNKKMGKDILNGVMAILPADHYITEIQNFHESFIQATNIAAKSRSIVTIGIQPTWACPSYGYIEYKKNEDDDHVLKVDKFHEKPSKEKASQYLKQNNFLWNAGMFFWSLSFINKQLQKHAPELANFVKIVSEEGKINEKVEKAFINLTPISIDFALLEKTKSIECIKSNFSWDDVGNWNSLAAHLTKIENNFFKKNKNKKSKLFTLDSEKNIIFDTENKSTALVGVKNMIIVRVKDSLLICSRDKSEEIKKIIDKLPNELK